MQEPFRLFLQEGGRIEAHSGGHCLWSAEIYFEVIRTMSQRSLMSVGSLQRRSLALFIGAEDHRKVSQASILNPV